MPLDLSLIVVFMPQTVITVVEENMHIYIVRYISRKLQKQLGGKCATGLVCVLNKANTFNVFTAAGGHIERIERKSVD